MLTSGLVKVIIPTSEGPTEILSLSQLNDPLARSIVCLNGEDPDPISAKYNEFVRRPTGIIEQLFGHDSYRLDLSFRIKTGSSWKLAAAIAHSLEACGRLYQPLNPALKQDEAPGALIWATGIVRSLDLAIGPVGHVESKLRLSTDLFEQAKQAGQQIFIVLPDENYLELPQSVRDLLAATTAQVLRPASFPAALDALGLPQPSSAAAADLPATVPRVHGNPYPGLDPFTAADQHLYFGRARAREECVDLLRIAASQDHPFLLIHGQSGVGKSSLIQAGLLADLTRLKPEGSTWATVIVRQWGGADTPLGVITKAIEDQLAGPQSDSGSPLDGFADAPGDTLRARLEQAGIDRVILVLDQLEQAFLEAGDAPITDLGTYLAGLLQGGRIWIVAGMRTDQLAALDRAPALARLASGHRLYRLERPSHFELSEMIQQPAALAGYVFETDSDGTGVVSELVDIALQSPHSLPLVQVVLRQLADLAEKSRKISLRDYRRIGAFQGALERLAEDAVHRLIDAGLDETVVDRTLAEFVRVLPASGEVISRSAPVGADADSSERSRTISTFVDARILAVTGTGADARADLAHETLLDHWDRLKRIANDLREQLILRDRIDATARIWHDEGRPDAALLTSPERCSAAMSLARSGLIPLDPLARDFIAQSNRSLVAAMQDRQAAELRERKAERRAKSGYRAFGIASSLLALVIGGFAVMAANQSNERRILIDDLEDLNGQLEAATVTAERERALAEDRATDLAMLTAQNLLDQGDIPGTLSVLLDVTDRRDIADLPVDLPALLERALMQAAHQTHLEIPHAARIIRMFHRLYFHDPLSGQAFEVLPRSEPIPAFMLPGEVITVTETTTDLGTLFLTVTDAGTGGGEGEVTYSIWSMHAADANPALMHSFNTQAVLGNVAVMQNGIAVVIAGAEPARRMHVVDPVSGIAAHIDEDEALEFPVIPRLINGGRYFPRIEPWTEGRVALIADNEDLSAEVRARFDAFGSDRLEIVTSDRQRMESAEVLVPCINGSYPYVRHEHAVDAAVVLQRGVWPLADNETMMRCWRPGDLVVFDYGVSATVFEQADLDAYVRNYANWLSGNAELLDEAAEEEPAFSLAGFQRSMFELENTPDRDVHQDGSLVEWSFGGGITRLFASQRRENEVVVQDNGESHFHLRPQVDHVLPLPFVPERLVAIDHSLGAAYAHTDHGENGETFPNPLVLLHPDQAYRYNRTYIEDTVDGDLILDALGDVPLHRVFCTDYTEMDYAQIGVIDQNLTAQGLHLTLVSNGNTQQVTIPQTYLDEPGRCLNLSPDGNWMAVIPILPEEIDAPVALLNAVGEQVDSFEVDYPVLQLSFSPIARDGRMPEIVASQVMNAETMGLLLHRRDPDGGWTSTRLPLGDAVTAVWDGTGDNLIIGRQGEISDPLDPGNSGAWMSDIYLYNLADAQIVRSIARSDWDLAVWPLANGNLVVLEPTIGDGEFLFIDEPVTLSGMIEDADSYVARICENAASVLNPIARNRCDRAGQVE